MVSSLIPLCNPPPSSQTKRKAFPGVCDGIFFDEAPTNPTEVVSNSELYARYNDYAADKGLSVTFNPGQAADPVYFNFGGSPTLMSYENFYTRQVVIYKRRCCATTRTRRCCATKQESKTLLTVCGAKNIHSLCVDYAVGVPRATSFVDRRGGR